MEQVDHRGGVRAMGGSGNFLWQGVASGWTSCVAQILWVVFFGFVVVTCQPLRKGLPASQFLSVVSSNGPRVRDKQRRSWR